MGGFVFRLFESAGCWRQPAGSKRESRKERREILIPQIAAFRRQLCAHAHMKFAYTKFPSRDPRKPWFGRPIVSVILTHGESTSVAAIVDSGADRSLFDVEVGKDIGLNVESGEVEYFGGIGGSRVQAFVHKVQLQVVDIEKTVEVPIGFTKNLGVSGILGQEGFFDQYRIKFEKDHDMFEIVPVVKR